MLAFCCGFGTSDLTVQSDARDSRLGVVCYLLNESCEVKEVTQYGKGG